MPAEAAIKVRNLAETRRAFAKADRELDKEMRLALREVVEPIREDAESLAESGVIDKLSDDDAWSRMRVGTTKKLVYVAPRERGRASRQNVAIRRSNFAELLMDRAMQPALDENEPRVVEGVERVLDTVGRAWESA